MMERELEVVGSSLAAGKSNELPMRMAQLNVQKDDPVRQNEDLRSTLRNETIVNEEQRAFIEFLKTLLDNQLAQQGLVKLRGRSTAQLLFDLQAAEQKLREAGDAAVELESQTASLEKELKERERVNQHLESEIKASIETFERTKETVAQLEEEKTALLDYVDNLQSKAQEAEKSRKALEQRLAQESKERAELEHQLEKERRSISEERGKLRAENEEARRKVEELLKEIELERSRADTAELRSLKQIEDLEKKTVGDVAGLKEELRISKQKLDSANEANRALQRDLNDERSRFGTNERRLEEFLVNLRKAERTISELEHLNNALEQEREVLRAELNKNAMEIEELTKGVAQNEDLMRLLSTSEQKCEELNAELNEMVAIQVRMETQLKSENEARGVTETRLNRVGEQVNAVLINLKAFIPAFELVNRRLDYQALEGQRLRDLMTKLEVYGKLREDEVNGRAGVEYIAKWVEALLEEVELLIKSRLSLQRELEEERERGRRAERRFGEQVGEEGAWKRRERELVAEITALREEKAIAQRERLTLAEREGRGELEAERHRMELRMLTTENERLKSRIAQLQEELSLAQHVAQEARRRGNYEEELVRESDQKVTVLANEKRALEELWELGLASLGVCELGRGLNEVKRLQDELDAAARAKSVLEARLSTKETELKVHLKRKGVGSEGLQLRREVEALRQELENCTTQLSILRRRREGILEDVREASRLERRRLESGMETEKELIMSRTQNQELRSRIEALTSENESLRAMTRNGFTSSLSHTQSKAIAIADTSLESRAPRPSWYQSGDTRQHRLLRRSGTPSIRFEATGSMDTFVDRSFEEGNLGAPRTRLKEKLATAKTMLENMRRLVGQDDRRPE
eukprot:TRINITY_DN7852_c0_g2_i1.p1 TRINITY_DN7852_c0_g2~~TRINITY_DN7852_c0_g2_i1.p1  ORF type:complete len:874 (+),score=296.12 TRINITY_DN7852_c0_g2_i1:98-2719(+)